MTQESEEELRERFVAVYTGAQERSARYWRQWAQALPLPARTVIEGMAQELSEREGIALPQAQARLAAEKVAADMGETWVREWLEEHQGIQTERARLAQKPLQPLVLKKRR